MYTTIEAEIDHGRIAGPEISQLPQTGHVLITWVSAKEDPTRPDWDVIASQLGKLTLRTHTAQWQRSMRDEWQR